MASAQCSASSQACNSPGQPRALLLLQKLLRPLLLLGQQLVHPQIHGLLVHQHPRAGVARPRPQGVLQLRRLRQAQARMHIAHAAVKPVGVFVVGAHLISLVGQRFQLVAGVLHHQPVAPEHVGDTVVAARIADRKAARIQQAVFDRRIAAHRPGVLRPVGELVQPRRQAFALGVVAAQHHPLSGVLSTCWSCSQPVPRAMSELTRMPIASGCCCSNLIQLA